MKVLELLEMKFRSVLENSPQLQETCKKLVEGRLQEMEEHDESSEALEWAKTAVRKLQRLSLPLTEKDLKEKAGEHEDGNAAMAIWLGIALDGIPESLVIGMILVAAVAEG